MVDFTKQKEKKKPEDESIYSLDSYVGKEEFQKKDGAILDLKPMDAGKEKLLNFVTSFHNFSLSRKSQERYA
jgi:hypothetical protein